MALFVPGLCQTSMLWLSRLEEKIVSPRNGSNAAARNKKVSLVRKLGELPEIAVYLSFWDQRRVARLSFV